MLFNALDVMRQQLSDYVRQSPDLITDGDEPVKIMKVGGDGGAPEEKLTLTLINVEEERTVKAQSAALTDKNGAFSRANPELKLNLYVLLSANFKEYETALKTLSAALHFFQGKNVFTGRDTPELAPEIEKLIVELHTLSFEQQNHLWATLGGKYLPSVVYRVRMLTVQQKRELGEAPPIGEVNLARHVIVGRP